MLEGGNVVMFPNLIQTGCKKYVAVNDTEY